MSFDALPIAGVPFASKGDEYAQNEWHSVDNPFRMPAPTR
jgi:hypothetical protein